MFCYKCGQPAAAGQPCPACGAVQPAQTAPPAPPGAAPAGSYGQQPPPPPGYGQPSPGYPPPQGQYGQYGQYPPPQPRVPSPLGTDMGAMFKGYFSANPLSGFERATQCKSIAGLIFLLAAALFALLAGLGISVFYPLIHRITFYGIKSPANIQALTVVKYMCFFVVMPGIAFFMPFLYNVVSKSRMTVHGVIGVAGLSVLPFIPLALVAFIFSFFYIPAAVVLLQIGLCLTFIPSYIAVAHLGLTRGVNPWINFVLSSASLIVPLFLL